MHSNYHRFIYEFLLIFLITLLFMFGMHYLLVHYAVSTELEGTGFLFDWNNLFRVNLFVIDLCVLLIVETLLILAFYKFTLPSIGIACVSMVVFLSFRSPLENTRIIAKVFSPLVSNKYAFLDLTDLILMLIINTVMISFLVTVLIKECESFYSVSVSKEKEATPSLLNATDKSENEEKKI